LSRNHPEQATGTNESDPITEKSVPCRIFSRGIIIRILSNINLFALLVFPFFFSFFLIVQGTMEIMNLQVNQGLFSESIGNRCQLFYLHFLPSRKRETGEKFVLGCFSCIKLHAILIVDRKNRARSLFCKTTHFNDVFLLRIKQSRID